MSLPPLSLNPVLFLNVYISSFENTQCSSFSAMVVFSRLLFAKERLRGAITFARRYFRQYAYLLKKNLHSLQSLILSFFHYLIGDSVLLLNCN